MRDSPGLLTRTREYRERKRECRYAPISSSHQWESPSRAHELVYSSFRIGPNLPHGRPPCDFWPLVESLATRGARYEVGTWFLRLCLPNVLDADPVSNI